MAHSKDQEIIVKKVLSRPPNNFYEILSVSKTDDASVIKKSYRKLAVRLHPDKNPHPRAAEAFKILNKAWEVLGDEDKKRIYDQTGQDPTSRTSGASSLAHTHPFASGFQQRPGGNFEEEIFNMFFGGAGGGARARHNGMGGAPAGFTFGNQGFHFQSFGGDPFQQRPSSTNTSSNEPQLFTELLRLLVPLLFVIIIPLLSGLLSSSLNAQYLFRQSPSYTVQRNTPSLKIPYFVSNDYEMKYGKDTRRLKKLGTKVERDYVEDKRQKCQMERTRRLNMIEESYGWFFNDEAKLDKARKMPLPNCEILRDLNLL